MRLLLDTHALLWFLKDDGNLSPAARTVIEGPSHLSCVSHATAWEVAIKVSLGKLRLPLPYEDLFPRGLEARGFRLLAINPRHFHALLRLPRHHGDPFDRLLIAQAQVEGLTLVTRDGQFAPYGVPLLW